MSCVQSCDYLEQLRTAGLIRSSEGMRFVQGCWLYLLSDSVLTLAGILTGAALRLQSQFGSAMPPANFGQTFVTCYSGLTGDVVRDKLRVMPASLTSTYETVKLLAHFPNSYPKLVSEADFRNSNVCSSLSYYSLTKPGLDENVECRRKQIFKDRASSVATVSIQSLYDTYEQYHQSTATTDQVQIAPAEEVAPAAEPLVVPGPVDIIDHQPQVLIVNEVEQDVDVHSVADSFESFENFLKETETTGEESEQDEPLTASTSGKEEAHPTLDPAVVRDFCVPKGTDVVKSPSLQKEGTIVATSSSGPGISSGTDQDDSDVLVLSATM